ncbi:MAG: hypothetical protein EAZ20_10910 [Bacteroidetes bacterium]|nr:MAG: hypothetical protein EAZ20_10910 [Bacteroidota bacterium]
MENSCLRLQNNPKIFEAVLRTQKKLVETEDDIFVFLGNRESTIQITIFTNLYCNPCSKLHQKIEKLLLEKDICLRLSFLSFEGKENATLYFLRLYQQYKQEDFEKILSEWYVDKEKNIKKWESAYPVLVKEDIALSKVESLAQLNQINQTPTIFVQGFLLPEMYSLENLKINFDYLIK